VSVTLTFWNKWVPVRREQTADGTTSVYFGIGRLSWQRKAGPAASGGAS
jgi:hypothetical protein